MALLADGRLDKLAGVVQARKITPAAVRVVDVPGPAPRSSGTSARSTPCSRNSPLSTLFLLLLLQMTISF